MPEAMPVRSSTSARVLSATPVTPETASSTAPEMLEMDADTSSMASRRRSAWPLKAAMAPSM